MAYELCCNYVWCMLHAWYANNCIMCIVSAVPKTTSPGITLKILWRAGRTISTAPSETLKILWRAGLRNCNPSRRGKVFDHSLPACASGPEAQAYGPASQSSSESARVSVPSSLTGRRVPTASPDRCIAGKTRPACSERAQSWDWKPLALPIAPAGGRTFYFYFFCWLVMFENESIALMCASSATFGIKCDYLWYVNLRTRSCESWHDEDKLVKLTDVLNNENIIFIPWTRSAL
jgi:hypothetical protein